MQKEMSKLTPDQIVRLRWVVLHPLTSQAEPDDVSALLDEVERLRAEVLESVRRSSKNREGAVAFEERAEQAEGCLRQLEAWISENPQQWVQRADVRWVIANPAQQDKPVHSPRCSGWSGIVMKPGECDCGTATHPEEEHDYQNETSR